MSIQSTSYITYLLNQLKNGNKIIVYDTFKPDVDKELKLHKVDYINTPYKLEHSQKQKRTRVISYIYEVI